MMPPNTNPAAVDFTRFIASLAATVVSTLHQVEALGTTPPATEVTPDEESGEVSKQAEHGTPSREERTTAIRAGLASARQLIDTMGMLEQKTKGNLTEEEQQFLESALSDLRIEFVRTSDRLRERARD